VTVTDDVEWANRFEAERPRLRRLALQMLGDGHADDDAVQEAWLRLSRTAARGGDAAAEPGDDTDTGGDAGAPIDNVPGWLTTVVSRICLDVLRSRASRREDDWPDEAEVVDRAPTPEQEVELADAVGQAMTVLLDTLAPAERLAYVLRDVFAVPFDQIAPILGRSAVATRQLASRARRRLQTPEPREDLVPSDTSVIEAFMQASRDNEFAALLELLDPDAEVRADGAALALGGDAGRVVGGRAVAEFFSGRARAALPAELDGAAAAVWQHRGEVKVVFAFTVIEGRVREIELLADPGVLTRVVRR
jgi:RNA polymerase sigma factor (sigma-70 family)